MTSIQLVTLGGGTYSPAQADTLSRYIWTGTFTQTSPMPWTGSMELYLRFDPEGEYPQPVQGIITWPDLGNARTRVEGSFKSETELEFHEVECLEGGCDKVVLGGAYTAVVDSQLRAMTGSATGSNALHGTFSISATTH